MSTFQDLNLSKQLHYGLEDLGFEKPTPIQEQSFSVVLSGSDMVGIAQTGTGKTYAYMLPLLRDLKFSKQVNPRILVLVPTRELVVQVVNDIEALAKYVNVRVLGIYGGVNINTQKQEVAKGWDIIVASPGRVYDLVLSGALKFKSIQKLVIDEVDVMLDLGFRFQILNIFELLPQRRQNIMFSATMTDDVDALITDYFTGPKKVSIAVSGAPLDNIEQRAYTVQNFYTKVNLLNHLVRDKEEYSKVLVFAPNKRQADKIFELLNEVYFGQVGVIHGNKTQNFRLNAIEQFEDGTHRILISTDVMARGLDIDSISHVINFDTPNFPENYMHRIGRTGRAENKGVSILFSTEEEQEAKIAIELLMNTEVPMLEFPVEVEISKELIREEQTVIKEHYNPTKGPQDDERGEAFHEKKKKNQKVNLGGSYRREIAKKYKKPKTRGDKNANRRKKRR